MGHANYSNLSVMLRDLLYAKGRLSVGQAVETACKRGETLQASEGEYDADTGMVGQALEEILAFWLCDATQATRSWGWDRQDYWHGPFVEPVLDAIGAKPNSFKPSRRLREMLKNCSDLTADVHAVASDLIRDEGGPEDYAAYVRDLTRLRNVYALWRDIGDNFYGIAYEDNLVTLDRILWRFTEGTRGMYKDIPLVGNVTH